MKFGIAVIVFNPDFSVLKRIANYQLLTDQVLIFDNTEVKNGCSANLKNNYQYYYSTGHNLGLSGALNFIFQKAHELQLEILLTMDQDSNFSNQNIKKMLDFIEDDPDQNIAIYCPNYRKLYFDYRLHQVVAGALAIPDQDIRLVNFSMTSGSFCLLKCLNQIKLTDLFIGYVDQELCYQILIRGLKIKMIGEIHFEQQVGQKVSNNFYNRFFHIIHHNKERYYYMIRNNIYLQQEFAEYQQITRELQKNLVRILINIVLGERKKIEKIRWCWKGYQDFKMNKLGR